MKFVLLSACLAVAVVADSTTDSVLWENFKLTHKKLYSSKIEEEQRFTIFQQNLRTIEEHNKRYESGSETYTMGVNQFADMTQEEFGTFLRRSNQKFNSSLPRTNFVRKLEAKIPKSIDWREKNIVTSVKNQGGCASCWAFATAAALEGAFALKYNKLVNFSVQQLVDCATDDYGLAGCMGGQLDPAYQYMMDFGLETEENYPYTQEDGNCYYLPSRIVLGSQVTGYVNVNKSDEDALVEAVGTVGPVAVSINADEIRLYSSGVFSSNSCNKPVDHGVLVVGYGTENGVDYWIIKNSWGTVFGENGYIRMKRGVNICNIAEEPAYPTL